MTRPEPGWPCDNYTDPTTCLKAGSTTPCSQCRERGREFADPHAPEPQTPDGTVGGESLALACPYCGASLSINTETVGPAYLTYEKPESIECDAYSDVHCAATWEPDGTPRTLPGWMRWPDLYSKPTAPPEVRNADA